VEIGTQTALHHGGPQQVSVPSEYELERTSQQIFAMPRCGQTDFIELQVWQALKSVHRGALRPKGRGVDGPSGARGSDGTAKGSSCIGSDAATEGVLAAHSVENDGGTISGRARTNP